MIFDSHCHLTLQEFSQDIDAVLLRAQEKKVRIITSGDSLENSRETIALVKKKRSFFPHIYATAGFHPYHADGFSEDIIGEYRGLLRDQTVIGLGEIGLDYHRDGSSPEKQREAFSRLLDLAMEEEVPVVIHNRNSEEDLLRIIDSKGSGNVSGCIHCFSGTLEHAKEFVKRGLMVSFAGQLTFPKADALREAARYVPVENMLIETDAPYLAPQEKRGQRNEPSYIICTNEKLAQLKNIFPEDAARITKVNTLLFYGLEDRDSLSPRVVYRIRDSLYINLTMRCTNKCRFCIKNSTFRVMGHNLLLEAEPGYEEVMDAVKREKDFKEIVFCGLGEPTCRLDILKRLTSDFKKKGFSTRLNTNGQGSLINGRNIVPELAGLIDSASVSLNAGDEPAYNEVCRPEFGAKAYSAVLEFAREASRRMSVTLTAVDIPEVNIEKCREMSENLNICFRIREEYLTKNSHKVC